MPDRELITATVEIGTVYITPIGAPDSPEALIEIPGVIRPDYDRLDALMGAYKRLGHIEEEFDGINRVREAVRGQLELPWQPPDVQPVPRRIFRLLSRTTVRRRWRRPQEIMTPHNLTPWLYATARFAPKGTIRVLTEAKR